MAKYLAGKKRCGAISALVAMAMIALVGCLAMSVDVGRLVLAKQQLQNAADAAAMAGVLALRSGMTQSNGTNAALAAANANTCLGSAIKVNTATDVVVGAWDKTTSRVIPWVTAADGNASVPGGILAVRVTLRRTAASPGGAIPTVFARIVGINNMETTVVSTAGLGIQAIKRAPVEMALVLDYSGSFASEFNYARDALRDFATAVKPVAIAGDTVGKGDKFSWTGFGDYAINSTNYPTAGFTYKTTTWHVSNVSYNFPLALTRMDTTTDQTTVYNKFGSSSKVFCFAAGADTSRLVYQGRTYSSSTNTPAGLRAAAASLKDTNGVWLNPTARHVVLLVTDGMPFFHDANGVKDATASKAATVVAADELAAQGIVIYTVTLCQDSGGTSYGFSGSDADFNSSLVRNGGYSFHSADPNALRDMIVGGVGSIEYGAAKLLK
ncbi:MAG TPA: pilus assembly protein TadG-related protein [Armatimonadota bacterium]|jgi:Flp pilus assembly protein TadG